MHHFPKGQAHVDETLTDAQGKFTFAAWGPTPAPLTAHLYESTPQLLFFKSGYKWARCVSDLDTDVNMRIPLSSDCDGKTIQLKKFTGNVEEYAKHLGVLDDLLYEAAFAPHDCSWKRIPRILLAMHQERLSFDKAKSPRLGSSPRTIEDRESGTSPIVAERCGSIKEYLRSYLP